MYKAKRALPRQSHRSSHRSAPQQPRHRGRRSRVSPLWAVFFFPAGILYLELLLRLFDQENRFFSMGLLRIFFFSMAAGLLFYLILDLIPNKAVSRGIGIGIMSVGTVFTCVEYCCKSFFKTYFSIGYMQTMAGQVVGDFFGLLMEVIFARIPFILLSFVPTLAMIFLRKWVFTKRGQANGMRVLMVIVLVLCQLIGSLTSSYGAQKNFYTYEYSANVSVPHFGVLTSMRLELQYAIFGIPEEPLPDIEFEPDATDTDYTPDPGPSVSDEDPVVSDTGDPVVDPTPEPTPIVYGYNVLDIDFAALADSAKNKTIAGIHSFMAGLTPTQQNEYTGYFEGKNLILITAEAFSPYVISEELTPTLYMLANNGFVFNNFYQPNWTQSTTGGEFAVMTGIIPTWVKGGLAFRHSSDNNMKTALGWQFQKLGYTSTAYHNNTYTYYGRNETHPNLGYDFIAVGNGLQMASSGLWPSSDLEMMQATIDTHIQNYVENGTNFHAYYMTVSGHCNYNWGGNDMSKKWKDVAQAAYPDASTAVQAYIACNLELEAAMAYLVQSLEDAGIADDTVIVLSADHYPYAMVTEDADYYNELTGLNDSENYTTRYKNTLILWSGCMDEPVVVDTPCSSIDIVPTLSNLFGLEYDSRLYSGRDILATNYVPGEYSTSIPLVVFANTGFGNSWITDAGVYEAYTGVFTPNPGVEVADDYVSRVSKLVQAKYSYAKLIIQHDYYSKVLD